MFERLPVVASRKLVDALRTCIVTVDRTDVLSVKACRMAPANDAGSTTGLSNNPFATPMQAGSMVYMLGMAHLATSSTRSLRWKRFLELGDNLWLGKPGPASLDWCSDWPSPVLYTDPNKARAQVTHMKFVVRYSQYCIDLCLASDSVLLILVWST